MPAKTIKIMAQKAAISVSTAESKWKEAKNQAKEQGQSGNYAYTMDIFKKMIHLNKSIMTVLLKSDKMEGGKADNSKKKYNEEEMKIGRKIEMEHTNDPRIAEEISQDHLEEFPDYYTRLGKMEDEAKKDKIKPVVRKK